MARFMNIYMFIRIIETEHMQDLCSRVKTVVDLLKFFEKTMEQYKKR